MNELLERYKLAVDGWPKPVDDAAVEKALRAHLVDIGATQKRIVRFDALDALDARGALDALDALAALDARGARDALDALGARGALARIFFLRWWSWDASLYASYAVGARQIGNEEIEATWRPLLAALEAGLWLYVYFEDMVVWVPQPLIRTDEGNRPHCEDGAAFVLGDWQEYFWHGLLVTDQIILRPHELTAQQALAESNAEIRRVLIERIGNERFTEEAKAEKVAVDDWGTLWRIPVPNDEPFTFVEVVNSTAEPDGSWKHYRLRVRPSVKTPLEAVASTWRRNQNGREMTASDYIQLAAQS